MAGLEIAEKAESQEICFLPDGGRDAFLEEHGKPQQGTVRDVAGRPLGTHAGIGNYTVGQRRGLNVAVGQPMYVHHIEAASNTVVISEEAALYSAGVVLDSFWFRGNQGPAQCQVQVRYRSGPVTIAQWTRSRGAMQLRFHTPVRAVAPGQTAVLYSDDLVVGGGRIQSTAPA